MKRMRALAIGALAAALGGVLAVGVSAHTDRYDSEIEITAGINSDYVYGGLNSPKASCEPKRKVKLYRKRAGDDELIEARPASATSRPARRIRTSAGALRATRSRSSPSP
jgi:hypothetical protein